jgi:phenylacetic acid degradation operon negative regulatory protein
VEVDSLLSAEGAPPVWSLIATIFGDVALVRGGVLSTACLIRMLGLVGVAAPAIRTALSRLVADGWLRGERDGRRSFYRMTPAAEAESRTASARIYALPPQRFDGRFEIVALTGATAMERQVARNRLLAEGFGALQPDVLLRPAGPAVPPQPGLAGAIGFRDAQADGDPAAVIAAAYDLGGIRERRARFLAVHARLIAAAAKGADDPAGALAARLLLIHGYRRLALREPLLPLELLPPEPGQPPLPRVVADAYAALLPPSEIWLDSNAEADGGLLPQLDAGHDRFGASD